MTDLGNAATLETVQLSNKDNKLISIVSILLCEITDILTFQLPAFTSGLVMTVIILNKIEKKAYTIGMDTLL